MGKFMLVMFTLMVSVGLISHFGSLAEDCPGSCYARAIEFASEEPQVKDALNTAMEDDKLSVGEYNDLYDLYKKVRTRRFLTQ